MNRIKYDGIKVFSATMHKDRDVLGERVTEWIAKNPRLEVVDTIVTQSSDQSYHCVSITVFYVIAAPMVQRERPLPTAIPGPGPRVG